MYFPIHFVCNDLGVSKTKSSRLYSGLLNVRIAQGPNTITTFRFLVGTSWWRDLLPSCAFPPLFKGNRKHNTVSRTLSSSRVGATTYSCVVHYLLRDVYHSLDGSNKSSPRKLRQEPLCHHVYPFTLELQSVLRWSSDWNINKHTVRQNDKDSESAELDILPLLLKTEYFMYNRGTCLGTCSWL